MNTQTRYHVADLPQNRPTAFDFRPAPATLRALAAELGLLGLRKVRLAGQIEAQGRADWHLQARFGATVVQPCVITLEPVTTRIDTSVRRLYLTDYHDPDEPDSEMPDDDTVEPLGPDIDIAAVLTEALSLNLPIYPRKPGAEPGETMFTEPGKPPMSDEDARPFAGLAGLREHLKKGS